MIGDRVQIGERAGTCVRYIEGGFAVDFRTLQEWSFATQLLVLGTVVVVIGAAVAWKVIRQRRLASAG